MTFGEIFKENRKRLSLTQEEIALRLMVTPQAVSKWETNQGTPDISLLIPISEEFDITVDELLGKSKKSVGEIKDELDELRGSDNKDIEKYRHLQKMLKSNPTNTDILLSLLGTSVEILKNQNQISDTEKADLVKDAEIYAKVLIERADRRGWDKHGYGLLSQIYMYTEDYKRASNAIENLPWTKFNRYRSRGDLAFIQNDYETARTQYGYSMQNTLSWMFYELRQLYITYSKTDVYKGKLYLDAMYKLHKAFFDSKTEIMFLWQFCFACMELAIHHACGCDDREKAFDYLNEYADAIEFQRHFKDNNLPLESKVFPQCANYSVDFSSEYIKRTFARKGLDPIRQDERFKTILNRLKIEVL